MQFRPRSLCIRLLSTSLTICLCVLLDASGAFAHRAGYAGHDRARSTRVAYRQLATRSLEWRRGTPIRTPNLDRLRPAQEVRGLWVVRDSLETPERIRNLVANAKAFGFNTLFVQVRGRGDAWYNSSFEPRAEELDNAPASFDPLQTVITDAHAAGLQVHAWVNMCYVWSAGRPPKSPEQIVNAHPDWLARDRNGRYQLSSDDSCEGAYLSPSNPQVRQHLHDVILDIVDNYDIDGIHFDYIRYPNADYDSSPAAESAFASSVRSMLSASKAANLDEGGSSAYVHALPQQWAQWRRDQITSLVEWVSKDVKSVKPWVCLSAAVYANYTDAYNARGQDWKQWLRDGALDAVVPMAYSSNTSVVAEQIREAESTAHEYGRACYAGIGSWRISAESTDEKIVAARSAGAQGVVLFSYGGVTADGANTKYLASIESIAFSAPASVPKLASVAPRDEAGS